MLERALGGVDAVCHQAAKVGLGVGVDVADHVGRNDLGTAALLSALHDRCFAVRIVLASSMVVYGDGRYRCPDQGLVAPWDRLAADVDPGRYEPACPRCGLVLGREAVCEAHPSQPRNVYATTSCYKRDSSPPTPGN